MKILHVCLDYPPRRTMYGSGTVNDDLLPALTGVGHDVVVLAPGRPDRVVERRDQTPQLVETPVEITMRHLLPPDRPDEMFATPEAVRDWNDDAVAWLDGGGRLRGWRPDIVHNDGWTTQPVADALGVLFRSPVVTTAHVIDRRYAAVPGRRPHTTDGEFRTLEERCFRNSVRVVVPSVTAHALAAHYYRSHQRKLRIVPHGLDWAKVDRLANGHQQGPDEREVSVRYVGRISSERAWRPFLDSFVAAARADRRLRLRMIGGGTRLAEAAERYRHPSIAFLGALPRQLALRELRVGDVFCNPALIETFGVAELEAMGLGACVISNDGFGKHTHVDHLVTGVRIPVTGGPARTALDQAAWTEWLRRLAADPPLRRRLGTAARQTVRDRFDVDRMVQNLLDVFEEALESRAEETHRDHRD